MNLDDNGLPIGVSFDCYIFLATIKYAQYSGILRTYILYTYMRSSIRTLYVIMSVERYRIEFLEDYIVCSARLVLSYS